ncbi:MAG: hypothetical protein Q8K75_04090 [Chlamydiales bacterium]|nr:hypothetical protein [Chlamydiales bacterium]
MDFSFHLSNIKLPSPSNNNLPSAQDFYPPPSFPLPPPPSHQPHVNSNVTVTRLNAPIANLPISILTECDENNLQVLQFFMDKLPTEPKSAIIEIVGLNLMGVPKNKRRDYCDTLVERIVTMHNVYPDQLQKQFEIADRFRKWTPAPPVTNRMAISYVIDSPSPVSNPPQAAVENNSRPQLITHPSSTCSSSIPKMRKPKPICRSSSSPAQMKFLQYTEADYHNPRYATAKAEFSELSEFIFHNLTPEQFESNLKNK